MDEAVNDQSDDDVKDGEIWFLTNLRTMLDSVAVERYIDIFA
jgi:hypothetical protein